MYPHRLVIDANRINARGKIRAMTALEAYHHAGALELIVTSTLAAELDADSIQAKKAKLYQSIGAYLIFYPGETRAQAREGPPIRSMRFHELYAVLFAAHHLTGDAELPAIRDCLHLDQAQINGADIFLTDDERLRAAGPLLARHGVHLAVQTAEEALAYIQDYYRRTTGTDELEAVRAHADGQGRVILGSNHGGRFSFIAARGEETLATIDVRDGLVHISARIRDESGRLVVDLEPGRPPRCPIQIGVAATILIGRGPILITTEPARAAVVSSDERTYFAVRTTHTGRVVISEMELRDESGQVVVSVQKETLTLSGAGLAF